MNPFEHDYHGQTTLAPLGLVAIIVLGFAMLVVPRRYAAWPMLVMACFLPPAQRVVILSLNFDLLRLMVLFASIRVLSRGEWKGLRLTGFDYLVTFWCFYSLFTFFLLFLSPEAIKYKLGASYDVLGMYFIFRILIRQWGDLDEVSRALAIIALPVAVAFVVERATGRNIFGSLGGVPEITMIREGRMRCQGAFAHPILAGCFWACAMPLVAAQWWRRAIPRWLTVGGLLASGLIVVLCSSSTPVSAVILCVPAMLFFLYRRYLKLVLWCGFAAVLGLQMVMNHGIWWLVTYVNLVGGSTAWFRYTLMQAAWDHLSEWWLIGSNQGTSHWGSGLYDVTNFYIVMGLHGGLVHLGLFVSIIVAGMAILIRVVHRAGVPQGKAIFAWALGVALLMHAANFIGVSYFGQIQLIWYMQLAMAGSLGALYAKPLPGARASQLAHTRSPRQVVPPRAPAVPPMTRAYP